MAMFYIPYKQTAEGILLEYEYEITSVDKINLTSTVSWRVLYSTMFTPNASDPKLTIVGDADFGSYTHDWSATVDVNTYKFEVEIASGSFVIAHNADGTKEDLALNFLAASSYGGNWWTGTWSIPPIRIPATINSVKSSSGSYTLYEDENFVIGYKNIAGNSVKSLQIGIADVGSDDLLVGYKTISTPANTSYTLTLTATDKQALYSYFTYSTAHTFKFVLKTVIDGLTLLDDYEATINIRNFKPSLNPTVVDNNSDTLRLTGSNQTLVKYMSDAYYTIGAAPLKGGIITEQFVRNVDTYYEASGTISKVESNTFYFGAEDSRGATSNTAIVFNNQNGRNWVDYIKLTCAIKDIQFDAGGSLTITLTGKYFNGSFGASNNKLTIDYKVYQVSELDGTWQTEGPINPTTDNNGTYNVSINVDGLDYLKRYYVVVKVSDELMATEEVSKIIASTPLFDWSEEDFRLNVRVKMADGFEYPQKLLWGNPDSPETYSQLGSGAVITLDEPISKQSTGIVLVFSLFRDNAPEDVSINSFFVSKAEAVHLLDGAPHMFMMGINSNLTVFGSKYVYISDDKLTGFEGNTNSGTASGINFNNSNFVLRYVIGV